ncbi:hypothetical protein [Robbsia andropogonis]|uniref:hypothetical protein n=1 Tax=Robbsia andropogonis TaxID=28092 RepID=UPI00046686EC|nr:hypothetical protein [Robbsia andropogonis]MCP1120503.1 hypothetical protein [Robbsia andropogonis]MCP1131284.1 hypothetical protein [Robbsia andropogonis]
MANGWTPQRRAKQAEAIRRWKPWEQSTGPTTDDGKLVSSLNAMRRGRGDPQYRKELAEAKRQVRCIMAALDEAYPLGGRTRK